jgi:hypothetical protein
MGETRRKRPFAGRPEAGERRSMTRHPKPFPIPDLPVLTRNGIRPRHRSSILPGNRRRDPAGRYPLDIN